MTNFIPFNQIDISYLKTNLNQQLDSTQALITQLEAQKNSSWQQIIAPLQALHTQSGMGTSWTSAKR